MARARYSNGNASRFTFDCLDCGAESHRILRRLRARGARGSGYPASDAKSTPRTRHGPMLAPFRARQLHCCNCSAARITICRATERACLDAAREFVRARPLSAHLWGSGQPQNRLARQMVIRSRCPLPRSCRAKDSAISPASSVMSFCSDRGVVTPRQFERTRRTATNAALDSVTMGSPRSAVRRQFPHL
jgi:hypothetical protein